MQVTLNHSKLRWTGSDGEWPLSIPGLQHLTWRNSWRSVPNGEQGARLSIRADQARHRAPSHRPPPCLPRSVDSPNPPRRRPPQGSAAPPSVSRRGCPARGSRCPRGSSPSWRARVPTRRTSPAGSRPGTRSTRPRSARCWPVRRRPELPSPGAGSLPRRQAHRRPSVGGRQRPAPRQGHQRSGFPCRWCRWRGRRSRGHRRGSRPRPSGRPLRPPRRVAGRCGRVRPQVSHLRRARRRQRPGRLRTGRPHPARRSPDRLRTGSPASTPRTSRHRRVLVPQVRGRQVRCPQVMRRRRGSRRSQDRRSRRLPGSRRPSPSSPKPGALPRRLTRRV